MEPIGVNVEQIEAKVSQVTRDRAVGHLVAQMLSENPFYEPSLSAAVDIFKRKVEVVPPSKKSPPNI